MAHFVELNANILCIRCYCKVALTNGRNFKGAEEKKITQDSQTEIFTFHMKSNSFDKVAFSFAATTIYGIQLENSKDFYFFLQIATIFWYSTIPRTHLGFSHFDNVDLCGRKRREGERAH